MNPYETQKLVDEYLLFHYGDAEEILDWDFGPAEALNFAVRSVLETFHWPNVPADARALDLGCAVGRSSFELSSRCAGVVGIDYSQAFVQAAETLRTEGELSHDRLEEAHRTTSLTATRPPHAAPDRIRFETGDAMNLREDLGAFELVHAANLLCRLREPVRFLERLPDLVKPEGQLALTTPCTWLEDFTPPENWPPTTTIAFLQDHLDPSFELIKTADLPFLIRETRRKFQWTVAQASVWRRR